MLVDGYVHPGADRQRGRVRAAPADARNARARKPRPCRPESAPISRTPRCRSDPAAPALYAAHGYRSARHFFRMVIDLDACARAVGSGRDRDPAPTRSRGAARAVRDARGGVRGRLGASGAELRGVVEERLRRRGLRSESRLGRARRGGARRPETSATGSATASGAGSAPSASGRPGAGGGSGRHCSRRRSRSSSAAASGASRSASTRRARPARRGSTRRSACASSGRPSSTRRSSACSRLSSSSGPPRPPTPRRSPTSCNAHSVALFDESDSTPATVTGWFALPRVVMVRTGGARRPRRGLRGRPAGATASHRRRTPARSTPTPCPRSCGPRSSARIPACRSGAYAPATRRAGRRRLRRRGVLRDPPLVHDADPARLRAGSAGVAGGSRREAVAGG